MILVISIIIIAFLFLGVPLIQGYNEKSNDIKLEKQNQAKESRIKNYMKEYRTLLANEPEKPNDYLKRLVNEKSQTRDDDWSIWFRKKMDFDGFGILQNEKSIAAKRVQNEINPPKKIRQKEMLERTRNILFKPYPNFEVLVKQINDHKYSFDDNVVNWDSTMIKLTKALKILKSIDKKYYANRNKYNLLYKSKVFLSGTSLKFEYNRNTYTIIINTGLTFNGNETEISNSPVSFKALDNQFAILLKKMEKELPKERFDAILDRIRVLASD